MEVSLWERLCSHVLSSMGCSSCKLRDGASLGGGRGRVVGPSGMSPSGQCQDHRSITAQPSTGRMPKSLRFSFFPPFFLFFFFWACANSKKSHRTRSQVSFTRLHQNWVEKGTKDIDRLTKLTFSWLQCPTLCLGFEEKTSNYEWTDSIL